MIAFLVRRVTWLVATLLVVYTVTFFLMRAVPGGPFSSERQPPPEIREAIARRYKLDLPLSQQYVTELTRLLRGDLGMSFRLADYSVGEVIAEGWQASASLARWRWCSRFWWGEPRVWSRRHVQAGSSMVPCGPSPWWVSRCRALP